MPLQFGDIYVPENFNSEFAPLKEKIESFINLSRSAGSERRYTIPNNKLMRICLLVGLSVLGKRDESIVETIKLQTGNRFVPSFFTHQELSPLYSALIKMRYHDSSLDLSNNRVLSRIIGAEMCRGRDLLLTDNNLENYLFSQGGRAALAKDIPALNLLIGNYGDAEMEATLDINSRAITNAQIIIAGATGSGKTITSFKTAWLASKLPTVDKVVFLVDRKALTSQTRDNYRAYDPEGFGDTSSIEDTANTNELSRKLKAKDNNIIVTSVQKLERLASRKNFKAPDRNFVFIVDEAHRSTGGQAFEKIQKAFKKSAWIGYTGTPIFTDTKEKDSTPQVFGNNLHTYTIREAIADKNVLGFKVDFMTTLASDAVKTKYLPDFFRNQHPNWSEEKIQAKIDN